MSSWPCCWRCASASWDTDNLDDHRQLHNLDNVKVNLHAVFAGNDLVLSGDSWLPYGTFLEHFPKKAKDDGTEHKGRKKKLNPTVVPGWMLDGVAWLPGFLSARSKEPGDELLRRADPLNERVPDERPSTAGMGVFDEDGVAQTLEALAQARSGWAQAIGPMSHVHFAYRVLGGNHTMARKGRFFF